MNPVKQYIVKVVYYINSTFSRKRLLITIPICNLLKQFHINQSHISILRALVLVAFFLLWINHQYIIATFLLVLNFLLDLIDGDLARMLKTDSDLGKFEDVTVDNIMVIIFPLALIWQGLISGFLGAYYIYIVSLSWWLSVIRLNQREKTNWIIKPQAYALLHFMRFWIITVLMFMYAFWRVDIFWETILILSIILSAISLYDYYQIIKVRLKSRNQPH